MRRTIVLRRAIAVVCLGFLVVAASAAILIPNDQWPLAWVRYRQYKGEFAGQPLVLIPPSIRRPTVPLEYHIQMTGGVCRIDRIDRAGQIIPHSAMGSGYAMRDAIPAGERLLLDPGSNQGRYVVGMGLKYHLLSPFLWRCLAGGMLFGLAVCGVVSLYLRGRKRSWLRTGRTLLAPLPLTVLAILSVLSYAILYPALHEAGHLLAGLALGGRIEETVLTSVTGETPHVKFSYLPDGAQPWMSAGGVFLPILVAYGLLLVWFTRGRRLSLFPQMLLLVPALLLLFPSFGIDDHLRGMALRLGCRSQAGILLVKTIPAWLTLAAYAVVGRTLWKQGRQTGIEASDHEDRAVSLPEPEHPR
jgi:hypothetical protein